MKPTECRGDAACPAAEHIHGCFAERPTPPTPDVDEEERVARAIWGALHSGHWTGAEESIFRQAARAALTAASPRTEAEAAVARVANWLCKEYGELLNGDADAPVGYWEFQARELLEAVRGAS